MRKLISILAIFCFCSIAMVTVSQAAQLYSAVASVFPISVSSGSTSGVIISSFNAAGDARTKLRIKQIVVSWEIETSTATFRLYDSIRSGLTNTPVEVFQVRIPSGTVAPNYVVLDYTTDLPKVADYSLYGALDNPAHEVSVYVQWW